LPLRPPLIAKVASCREFVAMRRMMNSVVFAALLLGSAIAGALPAASAAIQDGNWTVLIFTEKGDCDRGYSYDVKIANGHVSYQGAAAVNLAGTVASNGAVNVSIKLGEKGAIGRGRLSAKNGAGTWHGAGANGSCGGHWEAVRR
jgi:hypothetical protein